MNGLDLDNPFQKTVLTEAQQLVPAPLLPRRIRPPQLPPLGGALPDCEGAGGPDGQVQGVPAGVHTGLQGAHTHVEAPGQLEERPGEDLGSSSVTVLSPGSRPPSSHRPPHFFHTTPSRFSCYEVSPSRPVGLEGETSQNIES